MLTLHRQENVDSQERFRSIVKGINLVCDSIDLPVIFPVHPRTVKKIDEFGLKFNKMIKAVGPLDFLSFLYLEANASLILTDSGGVQEESCILKVPCVTLRENTERPETIKAGSNMIGGINADGIVKASMKMVQRKKDWDNPFGDGKASNRILTTLLGKLA